MEGQRLTNRNSPIFLLARLGGACNIYDIKTIWLLSIESMCGSLRLTRSFR